MAGAALLQDEAGNIDRVRMSDGRVFRIASTVATEAATEARSAAQRAQAAAAESSSATEELRRSQGANDAAQAKNGEAQRANDAAQLANNAAQMANNAAAKGLVIVQLELGQYSESMGRPTVDGEPGRLYVVPAGENASDRYLEFMWIGGGWERIGSQSSATAEPITAEDIDAALDYGSQGRQGTQVLNLSGLTYLCRKLVEMFGLLAKALDGKAGSSHTHSASDVSSGVLPASRGGTGVQSALEERRRLGLGTTTGALPVANGGTGATSAAAARASLGAASSADLEAVRSAVLDDTGWVTINSAVANGISYWVKYRAIGGICFLVWDQTGVNSDGWYCTGEIPAKYRPEFAMYFPTAVYGSNNTGSVWMPAKGDSGGRPWFRCYDQAARIVGTASWPYVSK
ncbi:hypothetical protein [Olsenella urininfantis]|uniref:hypothetical protein n=1 Tax=Olsenella urininfantis TaxID=1871033 RepID=UPI0009858BAA|nr:hypothetical protein [Olsenella urininfantis]